MDRFTRTADIIKAYYSYKQTADSATFVKKVCSFFDFIKDESLIMYNNLRKLKIA